MQIGEKEICLKCLDVLEEREDGDGSLEGGRARWK
jgi:hypothetical protein